MSTTPVRHRRREQAIAETLSSPTNTNTKRDHALGSETETAAFACTGALEREPLNIVYRLVTSLAPAPRNLRTHGKKQITKLAAAINAFGFTVPILIDEKLQVLAGHGRLEAAKLIGMERVPTIQLNHMSDVQKRAYVIADNKLAELAGWDEEALAIEFKELSAIDGFDIELTGFDTGEIDPILEADEDEETAEGEMDLTPAAGPAVTRSGDLWVLGAIFQGLSRSE